MRKLLRALFVCITLVGAVVAISTPSRASSGAWVVVCGYVRSLPDDPIVHPGAPGASHLHDFIGNTSVDAFSTFQSMEAASSTCPAGDRAGYWTPSVLRNGVKVSPAGSGVREQVYYTADNLASGTHVEPFPPDFRIVAGNSHATSASENPTLGEEIYWGCSDNSVGGKPLAPPSSCQTGILSLHVGFPNCWDGTLTHVDDTPHLRYPVSGGKCPAGFTRALPRIIMRTEYPVGTSSGTIALSSGPAFTAHADFWNTWDQAKLKSLVDSCLNADKDCGVFRGTTSGSVSGGTGSSSTTTTTTTTTTSATSTTVGSGTRHRHHRTTTTQQAVQSLARTGGGSSSTAAAAALSGDEATPTTTSQDGAVAAVAAENASSNGVGSSSSLPFTGAPMGAAVAVAVGLLGIGATTLMRTRKPRPRPRH